MSAYEHDDRVQEHPDTSWMVFSDDGTEYAVIPLRYPGTTNLIPNMFGAFDAELNPVDVEDGPFDEVVYALIGDPK